MKSFRRTLVLLGATATLASGCVENTPSMPDDGPPEDYETTLWTAEQVASITLSSDKSFPVINELPSEQVMPG